MKTKKAVFVYGRFNPPTVGHKRMIQALIKKANSEKSDPYIVITHTQNKKKNPLTPEEKKKILRKMFPNVKILATSKNTPNPKYIVKKLKNMNYKNISMMVGSNRVKSFNWVGIPVIKGGNRNPNAKNNSGVSATKARIAAMKNNKNLFKKSINNKIENKNINNMMKKIKSRLILK